MNICIAAPVKPTAAPAPLAPAAAAKPSITKPMWLMLLNAISRFRSVWRITTIAPYITFITAAAASRADALAVTSGNMPIETRIIP